MRRGRESEDGHRRERGGEGDEDTREREMYTHIHTHQIHEECKHTHNVHKTPNTHDTAPHKRGGGLGSRPKKMYGERLGDGVEYHLMKPTPRR